MLITGICLVPAGLHAITSPSDAGKNLMYIAAYLCFGVLAGCILGINRRRVQRERGATLVGAGIGAIGVVALVTAPALRSRDVRVIVLALLVGTIMGGALGSFMWRRARHYRLIT